MRMVRISISTQHKKVKKKVKVKKKSNKFTDNKDDATMLADILNVQSDQARALVRSVKKLSARKQNMGLNQDYMEGE